VLHSVRAAGGKAPDHGTADEDCPRAEGERDRDVRSAPDPAVHQDLDPIADGLCDLRERVQRGDRPVELPSAVVRDDDGVAAVVGREDGVLGGQDALDDHREAGVLVQPLEIAPREAWIDQDCSRRRRNHRAEIHERRGIDLHPVLRMQREPGSEIALPRAEDRQVDRQHHG